MLNILITKFRWEKSIDVSIGLIHILMNCARGAPTNELINHKLLLLIGETTDVLFQS